MSLSNAAPSLLAAIPADISLLAALPDRPDLLALLPSSSSSGPATTPSAAAHAGVPQPAPEQAPQTADAALRIARSFMAATAGDISAREREVERLGEKVDGLRAQLEEVRDGLQAGSDLMGWGRPKTATLEADGEIA